jgi:hypothetical protein
MNTFKRMVTWDLNPFAKYVHTIASLASTITAGEMETSTEYSGFDLSTLYGYCNFGFFPWSQQTHNHNHHNPFYT